MGELTSTPPIRARLLFRGPGETTTPAPVPLTDLLRNPSGPTPPTTPGGPPQAPPPRAPRKRTRRVVLGMLCCFLVLLGIPTAGLLVIGYRLDHNMHRVDGVFSGLENRPGRATGLAANAVNILVVGTDRRSDVPTTGSDAAAPMWLPGDQRTDAMMLLHVDGDRQGASVISIPRDAWIDIPGHGMHKANAAFSLGGPSLAVKTVESITGVRVDHLAVIDWSGFASLTDTVGGVDVEIPQTVHDSARNVTWSAGAHHLDGDQALTYVGERYGLPGGDLDRIRRQQAFLRAFLISSTNAGLRSNPTKLLHFADGLTKHLSIDAGWSAKAMAQLALSLRHLETADIHYLMTPITGFDMVDGASVVRLDAGADASLWHDVREDRMGQWAAGHPQDLTADVVN